MPLHSIYIAGRAGAGTPPVIDEGTFFDFEAETINPTIGVNVEMPRARPYSGPGGVEAMAGIDRWPLEYDRRGYPAGRSVLPPHRLADGSFGSHNKVGFASLSWFTTTGTFLIAATPLEETSVFSRLLAFTDGTTLNRLGILRHGTDCVVRVEVANVQVVRLRAGPLVANRRNKIALSYGADDWRLSVNGGAEVATDSGAVPAVSASHIGGERGICNRVRMHGIRHWDSLKGNLPGLSGL